MITATPDGIYNDSLIEIKCPTSYKSECNCIKIGVINKKNIGQVQLQINTCVKKTFVGLILIMKNKKC